MIRRFAMLVALFVLLSPLSAQVPRDGDRRPVVLPAKDGGFELFRGLLHFHGVAPVSPLDLDKMTDAEYRRVIVIVLRVGGRQGPIGFDRYTRKALASGGAVLLAADSETSLGQYLDRQILEVAQQAGMTENPDDCYARNWITPYVVPEIDANTPAILMNLFRERTRIAMNRPGFLIPGDLGPATRHRVAVAPVNTFGRTYTIALGGAGIGRNPFRSLVLADPDILCNGMLYTSGIPDQSGQASDNWTFANSLVKDFLAESGGRTKCLFVENGRVVDKFDDVELKSIQDMKPVPRIPLPNPLDRRVQAKLAEVLDGGLASIEDRHAIDTAIAGSPNDPAPRRYQIAMTVLASLAALALLALTVRRVFGNRHRKDFVPAPTDPLFLGDAVALGSFGQRRAELLRGKDFRAVVAHQIRDLFARRGLPSDFAERRLPRLEFRGRAPRDLLSDSIRQLWEAAAPDESRPLSYSEWKDLEPVLAEVQAAAAADRWRFATTPPQGSA